MNGQQQNLNNHVVPGSYNPGQASSYVSLPEEYQDVFDPTQVPMYPGDTVRPSAHRSAQNKNVDINQLKEMMASAKRSIESAPDSAFVQQDRSSGSQIIRSDQTRPAASEIAATIIPIKIELTIKLNVIQ